MEEELIDLEIRDLLADCNEFWLEESILKKYVLDNWENLNTDYVVL